jgi:hypothetical protein
MRGLCGRRRDTGRSGGMWESLVSCLRFFGSIIGVVGDEAGEREILPRKVQERRKIR